MEARAYTVILEPDDEGQGFTVFVPALPGCVTPSNTVDEAIAVTRDAIELYRSVVRARGEPIPDDITIARLQIAA